MKKTWCFGQKKTKPSCDPKPDLSFPASIKGEMSELVIDLTQDGGEGSSDLLVFNSAQLETAESGAESRISAMVHNCASSDPTEMKGSPIMTQTSTTSFQIRTNVEKIFYAPPGNSNLGKRMRGEPLRFLPLHAYPPEIEYKMAPSQLGPITKKAKINQCLAAKKEAAANITHEVLAGNLVIDPTSSGANAEFGVQFIPRFLARRRGA